MGSLSTFCFEMTESKGAKIFAVITAAIILILLAVAIILLTLNVMANEASIDANKHHLDEIISTIKENKANSIENKANITAIKANVEAIEALIILLASNVTAIEASIDTHQLGECPTPVLGSNPANYHYILGRCYYFEAARMNFTDAMENCEMMGGRLFEPRNSVVNEAVGKKAGETIASDLEGSMWIGMRTDSKITTNSTQRDFFYLSGGPYTRLPYGQWHLGEPNNANGEENCVQMYTLVDEKPGNSTWNDIPCYDNYPSICEMG